MALYLLTSSFPTGDTRSAQARQSGKAKRLAWKLIEEHMRALKQEGLNTACLMELAGRKVKEINTKVQKDPYTGQRLMTIDCGPQRKVVINCGN